MRENTDERRRGIESLLEHLRRRPGLLDRLELPTEVHRSVEAALNDLESPDLDRAVLDHVWARLRGAVPPSVGEAQ